MNEMEKFAKKHAEATKKLGISIGQPIPKEIPIKNADLKNSFLIKNENFKNPLSFPEC